MTSKHPYVWKDFLVDIAIIAVFLGILLVIVGSFPELFGWVFSLIK